MFIGMSMILLGLRFVPSNMALVGNYISPLYLSLSWNLSQLDNVHWWPEVSSKACYTVICCEAGDRREHLFPCCFVTGSQSDAWLTLDVPFDGTAVLQTQPFVQLRQNHFQLADLSSAGQRYFLHRQVHTGQLGCKTQKIINYKKSHF